MTSTSTSCSPELHLIDPSLFNCCKCGNKGELTNQFGQVLCRRCAQGKQIVLDHVKPGRNKPCPCGSGKKFKHCCGK